MANNQTYHSLAIGEPDAGEIRANSGAPRLGAPQYHKLNNIKERCLLRLIASTLNKLYHKKDK